MLEILEEVSGKIDPHSDVFEKAYLLDGEQVTSPLQVPIETRILIISKFKHFKGIRGLEKFESYQGATSSMVGGATYIN